MPSASDRQQLSTEELREASMEGPFGGIQSELPVSLIEEYGFADLQNIVLRKGAAFGRNTYTTLSAIASTAPLNFADYFSSKQRRIQLYMAFVGGGSNVYRFNSGNWTLLTGPALVATTLPFSTSVLNNKLCFSRLAAGEQLYLHDYEVSQGTYVLAAAASPAAQNIAEVGLHLMTSNTLESGNVFPLRYRWSGAGDPADWTSFSSGFSDQLVDLGPANGILKLGQYGFGFHVSGILQIIPTGIGFAPFAFVPLGGAHVGNTIPYSLARAVLGGTECGVFIGSDNVYLFNQTSSTSIGDAPIGGRRRLGARSRILADVAAATGFARGYVSQGLNGVPYNAYWLVLPGASISTSPIWLYNFDEENWTRFIFDRSPVFVKNYSPFTNNVSTTDFGDLIAITFADGTLGSLSFSNAGSETSFVIKSGKLTFKDRRHKKTIKKFRLCFTDLASVTFTLTITNESGVSIQDSVTLGSGSNDDLTYIFSLGQGITGLRFQYTLTAPSSSQFAVVELAPMYDVGGEQRGGTVDGN